MNKWLKKLKEKIAARQLHADVQNQLLTNFEETAKVLGDNESALEKLVEQFDATAKTLAESVGDKAVELNIKIDGPAANPDGDKLLSEDDVLKLFEKQQQTAADNAKQLQEKLDGNVKVFTDAIAAVDGLPDDVAKQLGEASDLITAEMSEDQVKRLAENQIALGNNIVAQRKLTNMGYQTGGPAGSTHIYHGDDNSPKQLQEAVHKAHSKGPSRYANGLILAEKVDPFVEMVLNAFDNLPGNRERIELESKLLAGENVVISDTDLPIGFQREVIREALSDTNILQLVQGLTDPTATAVTQIPYEERDDSQITNNGIVAEGQGIHGASVAQKMDLAYIVAMKLAMKLSNEVIYFTRTSGINWDAFGRNVAMNARIMRELIARRIANEMQRSADSYGALTITDEDLDAQLTGSSSTFKTAQFPIVRGHQEVDLQGNNIGGAENGITVRLNGVEIAEYNGTGNQAAGTYYRITNYNLGYGQWVNEAGVAQTPSATGNADDISYSFATNIAFFDLDNGSTALEVHLNGLLQAIGNRKAILSGDRFVTPNFLLMSPALNDQITNAEMFAASLKRDGTDTDPMGDLEKVKGIPTWGTNAPAIDLGDERIVMGQRGTMTYTIAKPFVTGTPFEAVDTNGRPTGQKVAYGEEYSAIKVPVPVRNRMTSVIAYSGAARTAF